MKVIVKLERAMQGKWETGYSDQNKISVRKCPPNYKTNEHEWIIELDDYTEEDIKNYFEIDTQIPDKDEETMS